MTEIVSLVIPFIALIFFIGMGENIVQFIENIINKEINNGTGFFIIFAIFFMISFSGDWAFFSYLQIEFTPFWMDYVMSSALVAAGSKFLEKKFDIINSLPSVITGIRVQRSYSKAKNKVTDQKIEEKVKQETELEDDYKYEGY